MFRWILRSILFSYASIYVAQAIVGGFAYENDTIFYSIIIAIALLNMFIVPVVKVLGLPHKGIGFLFLSFALTLVTLYILPMFLPGFKIVETTLAQLRIFGFVLPSKHLTTTWSAIYSALVVSIVFHFFEWLCNKR